VRALLFMLIAAAACLLLAHITPDDRPELRLLRFALRLFGAFFLGLLAVAVVRAFLGYN